MRGKTAGLMIGLAIILSPYVGAQPASDDVINVSRSHKVVECEPGSIPETSILDKTENDISRILNPEGYRQKYPGECSVWEKKYVVQNSDEVNTYQIEVMKYLNKNWALVSVQKDGEGMGYADIDMEKKDIGAADPHGHLKTELPEDNFKLYVETSEGQFELEGETR